MDLLENDSVKVVIIDEAGFGSKNQRLRNYGYAIKGKEVVFSANHTHHNLTAVTAMSRNRVEYV